MFTGTLYPFQEPALKRMLDRKRLLVAYEMGLGKTVLTIAAAEELLESAEIETAVIICAASLKYQWKRMVERFTDGSTVLVIEGPPTTRQRQYGEAVAGDYDYVVLNYEQVVNDWPYVQALPMDFVTVDEVQAIKGFRTKRSRRIKKLHSVYRYGLTGQPIENQAEEVFSIMQWIDDGVLGRFDLFDRTFIRRNNYGRVKYYRNLPTLHRRLAGAMVRKRQSDRDVRDQLPKVTEELLFIPFDTAGARLYRSVTAELESDIAEAMPKLGGRFNVFAHYSPLPRPDDPTARLRGRIMSKLTCLRMLCDHPDLLRIFGAKFEATETGGSGYANDLLHAGRLENLGKSPKLDTFVDLVAEILAANADNKIVAFSFFKPMLRMIQRRSAQLTESVLFTGDLNAVQKDAAKQHFATTKRCRLFLSSDAGGYGLDLPEANYLISYDLPWSAGKLAQRNSRIIRLSSQFRAVTVLSLQMAGSIEERQYELLEAKQAIASAVVDGRGIDRQGRLQLDLASLSEFLRSSAV